MNEPLVYTLQAAADAVEMSPKTLRRAIQAGELKAFGGGGPGKPIRISRLELANWWRSRGGGELFDSEDESSARGEDVKHF